ncbi:sensor histidine kinase [Paludibacterium purpuratum]|uniref:Two-component system LytT family sensor kinase n=1 Tax=Paludibacterium purpuratum TaxID=1144873 RepID=A0A4R7B7H4_9NEIS|nr:sensor histidine kinase [Paludibacterium purpuratum]TDR80710.1 two-component system LytT family sensor kinase [Paludibacterium purpuratum]
MLAYQLTEILLLMQQMCVYLVIAYLLSKTPLFAPLAAGSSRLQHKVVCYLVFSAFCIMGTYFGFHINDSIANTRATGAVLGGILGGPLVGFAVGLTGGIHRYTLGGFSAFACMVSTVAEGLLGGLVHSYLFRAGRRERLFNPWVVAATAFCAEVMQMLIILLLAHPFGAALDLVRHIALPMTIANSVGAGMFMRILLDRRVIIEKYSSSFSSKALKIAARAEGMLRQGFNQENSMRVARIIYEELGVGAVAMTDREKLLAFIGIGDDHHLPGQAITSPHTHRAIAENQVVFADGDEVPYQCSISPHCRLGSTLVIPLRGESDRVIGTIKLYEPRNKLISAINLTLGEGIARLLSTQILAGRFEAQHQLLAQTELKLLHAQVNPHFLFNALNTLSAVIRRDPERARQLVQHLSTFFRKNLKRQTEEVTLADEIEHVNAYLQIQQARFGDQLQVDFAFDDATLDTWLPAFSLQPIVENAVKHGTSQLLGPGRLAIGSAIQNGGLTIWVEDNAGLYQPSANRDGLGMNLVDRRIKARFGTPYGLSVSCEAGVLTRVSLHLPLQTENVA